MAHRDVPVIQPQFDPLNSTTTPSSSTEIKLAGNEMTGTDSIVEPIGSTDTLLHYLQIFWANRRLLLRTAICGLVASIAIAMLSSGPIPVGDASDASRRSVWNGTRVAGCHG